MDDPYVRALRTDVSRRAAALRTSRTTWPRRQSFTTSPRIRSSSSTDGSRRIVFSSHGSTSLVLAWGSCGPRRLCSRSSSALERSRIFALFAPTRRWTFVFDPIFLASGRSQLFRFKWGCLRLHSPSPSNAHAFEDGGDGPSVAAPLAIAPCVVRTRVSSARSWDSCVDRHGPSPRAQREARPPSSFGPCPGRPSLRVVSRRSWVGAETRTVPTTFLPLGCFL